jgi:hypothetical protein
MPGKTLVFQVHRLNSVNGGDSRHVAAGIDVVAAEKENEVAIDTVEFEIAGMDGDLLRPGPQHG